MSQKLTELKKQAAEIAEQIEILEAESPTDRLRRIVGEQVGAASMCWEHVDRAGIFDSRRASVCADEIMEAVKEHTAGLIAEAGRQNARIAELQDRLIRRDIKLAEAKILINNSIVMQKDQEMKIAERDARIDALEDALQDADKTERRLLSDIEEKDARIAELEKRLTKRGARIAELEKRLTKRDARIAELCCAMDRRDARITELVKQLAEKDEQLVNALAELGAVRSDRDESRRTVASFTTKTEPMPLRPAIEYLKEFPEPYRSAALKAVEERPLDPQLIVSNAADALSNAFDWADGTARWHLLHKDITNGTEWPSAELFND